MSILKNICLHGWFPPIYLFEAGQALNTAAANVLAKSTQQVSTENFNLPVPDFGKFPNTLHELMSNRLQLNRLLGLSNLFYIDPEDEEIRDELLKFRLSLAKIIMNTDHSVIQYAFSSDFSDRYWALVRSGIQSVPLSPDEEQLKEDVKNRLTPELGGGFGNPDSLSAFLVAMMLYQPGTMRVDDPDTKLPAWLISGYKEIFSSAISQ